MSQIAPLLIFAHVVVPSQVLIMINTPHLSIVPRSVINGLKQNIAHGGGIKIDSIKLGSKKENGACQH
ncbi:hypothetical protein NRL09_06670 [Aeromonas caviae]|uniref:hypothetical protein n=1 Tax=Aeromonas caviae TaxID=648 RepID=UPI0024C924DF|nr:hypothetical protein NRL03_06675 [Aeromonas caviae]WAF65505.1 hypothetical protein NRL19_06675 [Aeromonas caviae]WAF82331.1 hypothetical protein NRL09_06670 [Aeromonas caviae]